MWSRRLIPLFALAPAMLFGQASDATPQLAAARQALGGDAALNAVASFTVSGSAAQEIGRMRVDSSLNVTCVLPDKFLRVVRRLVPGGPSRDFQIADYQGFNGDEPIQDTVAPDAPMSVVIPAGPPPRTPAEIAAARQRQLTINKQLFVQLAVPLFVTSFGTYPLDFAPAGQLQLPTGLADAIDLKGPDGFRWRLFLDASSHLPVRLAWMGRPIVLASTTSTVTTSSRGDATPSREGPVGLPSGDPTAGMAPVEWQITIGDYRVADGLNWPHRLTTSVGGQKYEDVRLGKFKINPKIDPKRFAPR